MRRRNNKEYNIFSTSAIDLFASGMGAFIIIMVAAIPNFSKQDTQEKDFQSENLISEVDRLHKTNLSFLDLLFDRTKSIKKINQKIRGIASTQGALNRTEKVVKVRSTIRTAKELIEDISREIEDLKDKHRQAVASLAEKKRELEKLARDKDETEIKLKKKSEELTQAKLDVLEKEKEILTYEEQMEILKSKIDKNMPFVSAMLRWESKKHDLDIIVIDPNGVEQSYKEKSNQILSDSRRGPGGEMWFLPEPIQGEYTIKVRFYGAYGNPKKAKAHLSLVDQGHVYLIKPIKIKKEGEEVILTKFEVNQNLKIQQESITNLK